MVTRVRRKHKWRFSAEERERRSIVARELNCRLGREGPQGRDPKLWGAYVTHRKHARGRGVDFLLTFDKWLAIWEESGHINERGNGKYVMARYGDVGPYAVGNVRIITCGENVSEGLDRPGARDRLREAGREANKGNKYHLGHKHSTETRAQMRQAHLELSDAVRRANVGKRASAETRLKMSLAQKDNAARRKRGAGGKFT